MARIVRFSVIVLAPLTLMAALTGCPPRLAPTQGAVALWGDHIGGIGNDSTTAVALAPDGSTVAAGWFASMATLGAEQASPVHIASAGGRDAYVARYDATGNVLWAYPLGGPKTDNATAVIVQSNGMILLAGNFQDTAVIQGGNESRTIVQSEGPPGVDSVFLARFSMDGTLLETWKLPEGITRVSAMAPLPDGGYYMSGEFTAEVELAVVGGGKLLLPSNGDDAFEEVFLARFNRNDKLLWAAAAAGPFVDRARGISVTSDGGCYLAGSFGHAITFNAFGVTPHTLESHGGAHANHGDAFLARYNPEGQFLWARRMGGPDQFTAFEKANAVAALSDDSCYVTGSYRRGTAIFGEGEERERTLENPADETFFLAHFRDNGDLDWVRDMDARLPTAGQSVVVLEDDTCVAAGFFESIAVLETGRESNVALFTDTFPIGIDLFLARYNTAGELQSVRRVGGAGSADMRLAYRPAIPQTMDSKQTAGTLVLGGQFWRRARFAFGLPQEFTLLSTAEWDGLVARILVE